MANLSLTTRDVARELARRYSTMTHEELDILEEILVPRKYPKGARILDEGEVCQSIYWIVKGLVRQFYFKNKKELTEYMATENTICMSIESLFHETPSHQIIQALEPTILFEIPMRELESAAIKSVNSETQNTNAIFNLNGQQVEKAVKGLYIMNGKKVLVK